MVLAVGLDKLCPQASLANKLCPQASLASLATYVALLVASSMRFGYIRHNVEAHKAYVELPEAYVELHKAYVESQKRSGTPCRGTQDARESPELAQVKSRQGTKTV